MATNIILPTFADTFRYGHPHHSDAESNPSLAGSANGGMGSALCGSITRGIGYRNLAGRMAMFSGGGSIPDWWTPLLTASWPNQTAFDEYPQDTANYNDIYATY